MKRKTTNPLKKYNQPGPAPAPPPEVKPRTQRKVKKRRGFKVAPERWQGSPEPQPPKVGPVGGLTRILLVCPIYELYEETLASIYRLRWPGWIDYLFPCENPEGDSFADIEFQYRKAQEVFLHGNYDAMFTIESDVIAPSDAMVKLAQTGMDIAYGIYACRYGGEHRGKWSAYLRTLEDGRQIHSISSEPQQARAWWGDAHPCTGVGLGCTMIRRHVLEQIELRCTEAHHPDTNLAREANRRGISQIAHFGVICGHIMREPRGVLWPDPSSPQMYTIVERDCKRCDAGRRQGA